LLPEAGDNNVPWGRTTCLACRGPETKPGGHWTESLCSEDLNSRLGGH